MRLPERAASYAYSLPVVSATAGVTGEVASRLRLHGPSPREIRELFPGLAARTARRLARSVAALEFRNRLLLEILQRHGLESLDGLVVAQDSWVRLKPPAILVSFHVGALPALPVGLRRLAASSFVIREGPFYDPPPGHDVGFTRGDARSRAGVLADAMRSLRTGGFVSLAIDRPRGTLTEPVACLGRLVRFGRGAFALARLTGAPLVPVTARWGTSPRAVLLEAHEPLAPLPGHGLETGLAGAAGRWLERHLLESPEQVSLGSLFELLDAPRI